MKPQSGRQAGVRSAVASTLAVYKKLVSAFGRQGWWPVSPVGGGFPVYRPGFYRPLDNRECFEVCVGAILTQNTAWTNVEKALKELLQGQNLSPEKIIAMPDAALQKKIRSSGYYVQKAKKLKVFAKFVSETCGNDIARWLGGPLDARRRALLDVYGIGPETADSILLYAGRRPIFVIDAYTLRLARRMGWLSGGDYSEAQNFFIDSLPRNIELYNEYHALIVRLGKDFCRKKPECAGCPVCGLCVKILED